MESNWIKFTSSTPSSEGLYLIAIQYVEDGEIFYEVSYWDGVQFTFWNDYTDCDDAYGNEEVKAWMTIP